MRKFGEYSELSQVVIDYIEKIVEKIETLHIEDVSMYYGYPLIELDRQENIIKGCIVSKFGIIALYEVEDEKNIYTRHFMQIVMSSPNLSQMYFEGKNVLYDIYSLFG